MSDSEMACVYAALMLADDDIDITADKINVVLKAAGIKFVEPYLPALFANALNGKNVKDMLFNVSSVGAGPGAAPVQAVDDAAAAPADSKPTEAEKKKEETEESDEDMGFDLFG